MGCRSRDWSQLRDLFRENKKRLAILLLAGVWSAAVIFLYFPGNIWKSWFFLGNGEYLNYSELAAYLTGASSLEDAVTKAKTESRRYAKRQMTWARRYMADWEWFPDAGTAVDAVQAALSKP